MHAIIAQTHGSENDITVVFMQHYNCKWVEIKYLVEQYMMSSNTLYIIYVICMVIASLSEADGGANSVIPRQP